MYTYEWGLHALYNFHLAVFGFILMLWLNLSQKQENTTLTEASSQDIRPSYLCITPDLVWSDIEESVKFKYQVCLFVQPIFVSYKRLAACSSTSCSNIIKLLYKTIFSIFLRIIFVCLSWAVRYAVLVLDLTCHVEIHSLICQRTSDQGYAKSLHSETLVKR